MSESAAAVSLDSEVCAVTLFRRGAAVTRRAPVGDAPPALMRIDDLPLGLEDASVSVAIEGGGGHLRATDVRLALEVPDPNPEQAPAEDPELEGLAQALSAAQRRVARGEKALAELENFEMKPRPAREPGAPPGPSPAEARLALLELRERRSVALLAELAEAEQKVRDRARAHRERAEELARQSSAKQAHEHELRKSAFIRLERNGPLPEGAAVLLSYRTAGARWAPAYVLQLDAQLERGTLAMKALIRQDTGEDWSSAALTLSTAAPQSWSELPVLEARRLGRAQPPAPPKWRPPPADTAALFAAFDARLPSGEAPQPLRDEPPITRSFGEAAPLEAYDDLDDEGFEADEETGLEFAPQAALAAPPSFELEAAKAAAPAPLLAAVAEPMRRRSAMAPGGGGAPKKRPRPSPPPPEPVLDDRLDTFSALYLPGPTEDRRGLLTPVDADEASGYRQARPFRAFEEGGPPRGHRFVQGQDGFDYAFAAEHPMSVPSDGRDHLVPLFERPIESRLRHVCVPRESSSVFRVVDVQNPLDAPLLPGPIDVSVGEAYLLTLDGETVAAHGQLEVGLGVEQSIRVARNPRFEERSSGFIRGFTDLVHELSYEIRNNLDRSALLELRERVPTPAPDEKKTIEVSFESVQPDWNEYQPEDGELKGGRKWMLELAAGEQASAFARYVVRIPSGKELEGGNRRER